MVQTPLDLENLVSSLPKIGGTFWQGGSPTAYTFALEITSYDPTTYPSITGKLHDSMGEHEVRGLIRMQDAPEIYLPIFEGRNEPRYELLENVTRSIHFTAEHPPGKRALWLNDDDATGFIKYTGYVTSNNEQGIIVGYWNSHYTPLQGNWRVLPECLNLRGELVKDVGSEEE